ncbi:MAG: ATP-binding protein [Candidatus Symbiobacter sp.]|nr:ATP-binding protein [Candidatus Symbiobacter sp.]
MLLEFKVSNYRSFHQECVLRMDAVVDEPSLPGNVIDTGCASAAKALRSAVIYGANGSGKSNLLAAMAAMVRIIRDSLRDDDVLRDNYDPFLLDATSRAGKTQFSISFLFDNCRYDYGFSYDATRIYDEYLQEEKFEGGSAVMLFRREWDGEKGKYVYEYNDSFEGPKELWEEVSGIRSLYLTVSAKFNGKKLLSIRDHITRKFEFILDDIVIPNLSNEMIKDEENRNEIARMLKNADTGIRGIYPNTSYQSEPYFDHSITDDAVLFSLSRESGGTQKLYALSGRILTALKSGKILVIDELENSIHPLIFERIVELFNDPKINTKNAQIILATHNALILHPVFFRPDQIWIMSKNYEQESTIESLSEYEKPSGKGNDTYLNIYLAGRVGGTPIKRSLLMK